MGDQQLLEKIEALVPELRNNASKAENLRQPVDEVWQAICDAGTMKAFVPKRFGGIELALRPFVEIGIALGQGCASTAWVTTFCMEHNWLLAQFDIRAQEEIFGHQPYIVAPGAISPSGQAIPVKGGFLLSGRWQWGTGVMHSDWALLAGMVGAPEEMDLRMFVLPMDQVEVIDTWHVEGMVGTGSNDMKVSEVFIPEHRAESVYAMAQGRGRGATMHENPIFRVPMLPLKCITAASPAVGIAKEAVRLFHLRVEQRMMWGAGVRQKDHGPAQMRLGLAQVRAEKAEQAMLQLADEVEALGHIAEVCTPTERARLRLHSALIVRECRDIVRDIMEASGASAHFLDNPLQRLHRDIHTIMGHTVYDLDIASTNFGRGLLGQEIAGLV